MTAPHPSVKARLNETSLNALLIVVAQVLGRTGFGDVVVLGRRAPNEKSDFGGHELACRFGTERRQQRAVVKVVRKDSARLRMLSELAGTVLLRRADLGILVCTKSASADMRALLTCFGPVRIDIVDGTELASLMTALSIGVRPRGEVDYAYFEELEAQTARFSSFLKEES